METKLASSDVAIFLDPVEKAIKKFQNYIIISITNKIKEEKDASFSFIRAAIDDNSKEIKWINIKKGSQ